MILDQTGRCQAHDIRLRDGNGRPDDSAGPRLWLGYRYVFVRRGDRKKKKKKKKKNGAKRLSFPSPSEPSLSLLASLFIPTLGCCPCFRKKSRLFEDLGTSVYLSASSRGGQIHAQSEPRLCHPRGRGEATPRRSAAATFSHDDPSGRPTGRRACLPAAAASVASGKKRRLY